MEHKRNTVDFLERIFWPAILYNESIESFVLEILLLL